MKRLFCYTFYISVDFCTHIMYYSFCGNKMKGGLFMSSRLGRPTDSPKTSTIKVRLSDNDMQKLNFLCSKTGKSKSEIVRDGIEKVFEENK